MKAKTISFDARMAEHSGIGTYIRGLLDGFSRFWPDQMKMTIFNQSGLRVSDRWPTRELSAPIYSVREQIMVPRTFHQTGSDLLHVPHYNIPAVLASRCIVTVHDLIHLKFPQFLPSRAAYIYAWTFFHHIIPRARAVLCVSESTKQDLLHMTGVRAERITVTPLGVPAGFRMFDPTEIQPTLERLQLTRGYFLYVGNLKAFKNVPFLLAAYRKLRQRIAGTPPLVLIGRNFLPGFEREIENIPQVRWFPAMDRVDLPKVYAGAISLLFPSLYEGFGLPPLEAMACGVPVICSARGALPEVVGDAALTIDPTDEESLIDAMEKILSDASLRERLTTHGVKQAGRFSWDETARKTLAVYEQCLA